MTTTTSQLSRLSFDEANLIEMANEAMASRDGLLAPSELQVGIFKLLFRPQIEWDPRQSVQLLRSEVSIKGFCVCLEPV